MYLIFVLCFFAIVHWISSVPTVKQKARLQNFRDLSDGKITVDEWCKRHAKINKMY